MRRRPLKSAARVVRNIPDHPVCSSCGGCAAFFLMSQPPLLYEEGTMSVLTFHSYIMKRLDRSHILTRIIEAKQKRLQVARMRVPEAIVRNMAKTAKPVASFRNALETPLKVRIIAEVKKASPS